MSGLSSETQQFLAKLRANNHRDWFATHKPDYERCLKHPGEAFAAALADELAALTGAPHEYRVFRIHRDVRFAKDKTPYNAHLHISLSPGGGCKDAGPAWMFGLDPDGLTLGAGIFAFQPRQLENWRNRCAAASGVAIAELLPSLAEDGMRIAEPELKRVPAPFEQDHPRGSLLRRKGLAMWIDLPDAGIAFGPQGAVHCADQLMRLRPVFDLLAALQ